MVCPQVEDLMEHFCKHSMGSVLKETVVAGVGRTLGLMIPQVSFLWGLANLSGSGPTMLPLNVC